MPMLNRSIKTRATSRVGDKQYGRPGGYRDSWAFVCSYDVAVRLAAEAGIDMEHAHRFLIALGKVAQGMLLAGEPVGLPYLGVLVLRERLRRINTRGLLQFHAAAGRKVEPPPGDGVRVAKSRLPGLYVSDSMKRLFHDNAIYTGDLAMHVARKREKLKNRLRTHKHGGLKHTKE